MDPLVTDKPHSFRISEIKTHPDKFWINSEYQRSEAWDSKKRQNLIISILMNLTIGVLFFYQRAEKPDVHEVLDGQQRIETIKRFIRGDFTVPPAPELPSELKTLGDKKYEDLGDGKISDFDSFEIWYLPVRGGNDIELADLFLRLQEGQSLNTQEKLNSIQSKMKKFVIEMSQNNMFRQLKIANVRFAHRLLAANCVYYAIEGNFEKKTFPRPPRYQELKGMYESPRFGNIPNKLHKRVVGTLDYLTNALGEDIKIIGKASDIPVIFTLANYVRSQYAMSEAPFNRTITDFMPRVEDANMPQGKPRNRYQEYKMLRRAGATEETFNGRFGLLLTEFEKVEGLIKKDPARYTTFGKKLLTWYRFKKKCVVCGNHVDFEDISIDHVKEHAKGGPSAIENYQLVHKGKCHAILEERKNKS